MSRRYLIPTNMFYRENDPLPPDFPQPNEGDHYFNTVSKTIRVFYDDAWREVIPEVESPQAFHMRGTTSVPSADNSETQMVFSGADIQINTLGVVVTATTLTVPVAGWYLGALSVQQGSAGGTVRVLSLTKTGGVGRSDFLNTSGDPVGGNTSGFGYRQGMSNLIYVTPDDELIMWGRQDSGVTVDLRYDLSLILVDPDAGVGGIGTGGISLSGSGDSGVGLAGPPFFATIRRDASRTWDGSAWVIDGWDTEAAPSSDEIIPMQWTSTGVIVPKDGVYVAMGRVQFDTDSAFADARFVLEVSVNGADSPDQQVVRGHAGNSIYHLTTTPRFYYAGTTLSVKVAVLGGPASVNLNDARLTVVSVAGAGQEYTNPALAQEGNFTEDDFPSLNSGAGLLIGSVTFIQPFKTPPFVTLEQSNLPGGSQWLRWVPYNVTTTGFDIYVYNLSSAALNLGQVGVDWRAVGPSDTRTREIGVPSQVIGYVPEGTAEERRDVVATSSPNASLSPAFTMTGTNPHPFPVLVRVDYQQLVYLEANSLLYLEATNTTGGTRVSQGEWRGDYPDGETGTYYPTAHSVSLYELAANETVTWEIVGRMTGGGPCSVRYNATFMATVVGVP